MQSISFQEVSTLTKSPLTSSLLHTSVPPQFSSIIFSCTNIVKYLCWRPFFLTQSSTCQICQYERYHEKANKLKTENETWKAVLEWTFIQDPYSGLNYMAFGLPAPSTPQGRRQCCVFSTQVLFSQLPWCSLDGSAGALARWLASVSQRQIQECACRISLWLFHVE